MACARIYTLYSTSPEVDVHGMPKQYACYIVNHDWQVTYYKYYITPLAGDWPPIEVVDKVMDSGWTKVENELRSRHPEMKCKVIILD